jgi:superfamily I DNA/RNA helicase
MEMGRGSLTFFRLADGSIVEAVGTFIGGTGRLGNGAVLIKGHDFLPDGVYELTSKMMHRVDAFIPESVLKRQGIKKSSVVTDMSKIAGKTIADLPSTPRRDITPDDERIAAGDLTPEEKANIEEGRANSPLADLPAGYEVDNPAEVEQMLKDAGVDLEGAAQVGEEKSGFKKPAEPAAPAVVEVPSAAKKESKLDEYSQMLVDDLFKREEGKTPAQVNRTIKALYNQMAKNGENDASKELLGRLNKLVEDKGGKPYVPEVAPEGYFKRGQKSVGDYSVGDKAAFFNDILEEVEPLTVVGKEKDSLGQDVLQVKFDGDDKVYTARADELQPFDSFAMDSPELASKMGPIGNVDSVAEKAVQDAMDGKPVDVDNLIKLGAPITPGKGAEFFEDPEQPEGNKPEPKAPAAKKPAAKKPATTPSNTPVTPSGGASESLKPKKQEPISIEELAALAKPEEYEKYFGFVPSEEQTNILNAILIAKKNTAVRAGAGAGKTTTSVGLTNALMEIEPEARVAFLQLNTTNAAEAAKLVPKNTVAKTVDAYFGRKHLVNMAQGKTGTIKGKANKPFMDRYRSKSFYHIAGGEKLANHFLMDEMSIGGENYTAAKVASLVSKAVDRYARSTDEKIGPQHFNVKTKAKKGETAEDVEIEAEKLKKLVSYAEAYWDDLTYVNTSDDIVETGAKTKAGKPVIKTLKGVTVISPTHAFKMWALSNPDFSKLRSPDGKPVTHMVLDEAQDTNVVFEKVINDNLARGTAPIILMVGDRAQGINSFRGTKDALTDFANNVAGASLTLTTTRRFGTDLLPHANGFLNLLGEEYRLKSAVGGGEILPDSDFAKIPDFKNNTAIQTRTNAEVFNQLEQLDEAGYTAGVTDSMYKDLTSAMEHLDWLVQDFNSRPANPKLFSDDFVGMRNLKALITEAEIDPQSKAGYWWRLIQEDPESKIKKLKELTEKLIVEREQIDIESVTNLDASDGSSGRFKDILWRVQGDYLQLTDAAEYALFTTVPGRTDRNFREIIIGNNKTKMSPELKLPDGSEPSWRVSNKGAAWDESSSGWVSSLLIPEEEDRAEYLNKMASLFMEDTKEPVIADILVSTAHRFKGLERDNIIIAGDFPVPEVDDKGNMVYPGKDEYQLGYVAVTRARKRLYPGSLAYGLDYTGQDGMRKANTDLERDPGFGLDLVAKEEEAQEALNKKRTDKGSSEGGTALKSGKGQNFAGGFQFFEDEDSDASGEEGPGVLSTSPNTPGKELVSDWFALTNGTYSKRIDGTTWNIRENKDGTIVARPRTNESRLGSFKFNSWSQLANDFPNLGEKAKKANRDVLKDKVSAFDPNGDIARAIDNDADPRDIADMISKSDEFKDAIEDNKVNYVSIFAAVDNIGSSDLKRPNPRAAKPKVVKPKKAAKPVAVATTDIYNNYPNNQMKPTDQFSLFDGSILAYDAMLKEPGMGSMKSMYDKLVKFGGKVNPDGSITVYKKNSVEEVGPNKDANVSLEIKITGAKSTEAVISYTVTDLDSGESQEFWDMSNADSLKAALNRVKRRLETNWLRDPETLGEKNPDTYGGIFGAINQLRTGVTKASARKGAGGIARVLEDKTAKTTNIKIRTPMEHMQIALNGRDDILNSSVQNFHTKQNKAVPSAFEALEAGDVASAAYIMRQYLNMVPNTPAAQQAVREYLSATIRRAVPDVSTNKLNAMLDDSFDIIEDSQAIPVGGVIRPHLSRNGVSVEPGQIARWRNNVGQEAVGRVAYLVPYDNPDGGSYVYGDFVEVEFADGQTVRLNSGNMDIVDSSAELTSYAPWIREDEKKILEAYNKGFTVDFNTGEIKDKESVVVVLSSYKGYADVSTDNIQKSIKDVKIGDVLYDDKGNAYGKVESSTKGIYDGVRAFKVLFGKGSVQPELYFADDEQVNVPKPQTSAPATTTNIDLAKAAAELNLAPKADGTSSDKEISSNPTATNPATNTDIKGTSRKAVKPTDEANAILDKQLELGAQAWDATEGRIVDELNEAGYQIKPGTKYEDLEKSVVDESNKTANASVKAKQDLDSFIGEIKNGIDSKVEADTLKKMEAEGLADQNGAIDFKKLAKKLVDSGLQDYSYEIRSITGTNDSDQLSGIAAYLTATDPRNKSKASRLFKSLAEKSVASTNAKNNRIKFAKNLKQATKSATKKTLEDLGVKFDNVSLNEFEGRIISVQDNQSLDAFSTFKSARALRGAFDHMPSARIRQLAKYLKDNNVNLQIQSGVERGHFKRLRNGDLEITLSTSAGTSANETTALHELQHFLDFVDNNGNKMAHAWLHRRATGPDGKLRPLFGWGKGEIGFSIDDLSSPYTTRRYESGDFVLDPNFDGNEVNSTIMEDLFLDAGSVSKPTGQIAIVKKTRQKVNRKTKKPVVDSQGNPVMEDYIDLVANPYHDKTTDKWYADESMTEELNVREWYGRKVSEGLDRNVKHYGMGMMLMMNDWSATEGLGE